MSSQQTILFLGATGGVTNACLSLALKSRSYRCIALVRTPQKLTDQLKTQQKLDDALLANLTILQGNALDQAAVKSAILAHGSLPNMIMSGLGGAPSMTFNIRHPLQFVQIDQPNICENAAKTLVSALQAIYNEEPSLTSPKPAIIFVSTTGISRGAEDVPFGLRTLYHGMLAQAHEDKKGMESVFRNSGDVFSAVTGIRPTLLAGAGTVDGSEGKGVAAVKAGTEREPHMGFLIQRADVGAWVYENVVEGKDSGRWRGEMCSLAYA